MVHPDTDTNGWAEWKNYVLKSQEETHHKLDELLKEVRRLEVEMSAIKIKSGLLGTISGLVGGVVGAIGKGLIGGGK